MMSKTPATGRALHVTAPAITLERQRRPKVQGATALQNGPGGWVNINQGPNPHKNDAQNALARAPISAATAPLPPQTGLNGSHAGTDSIKPIWGGRGAAGKKLFWQPLCCPKHFFAASARPLRPKISEMPDVVAGKARAKSRRLWWRFHQKQCLGEKRGHRIDRHPLGLKLGSRLSIVDDHADDDIRYCGGPIGAKRRQKRRSHGFLHGFWPFSQRDAAQLLPRLFEPVARLLWPFFVSGFVAG